MLLQCLLFTFVDALHPSHQLFSNVGALSVSLGLTLSTGSLASL